MDEKGQKRDVFGNAWFEGRSLIQHNNIPLRYFYPDSSDIITARKNKIS